MDISDEHTVYVGQITCLGQVYLFDSIKEAEKFVGETLAFLDPTGVQSGKYYIDAPEGII